MSGCRVRPPLNGTSGSEQTNEQKNNTQNSDTPKKNPIEHRPFRCVVALLVPNPAEKRDEQQAERQKK